MQNFLEGRTSPKQPRGNSPTSHLNKQQVTEVALFADVLKRKYMFRAFLKELDDFAAAELSVTSLENLRENHLNHPYHAPPPHIRDPLLGGPVREPDDLLKTLIELLHAVVVEGLPHQVGDGGILLDADGLPLQRRQHNIVGVDEVVLEVKPRLEIPYMAVLRVDASWLSGLLSAEGSECTVFKTGESSSSLLSSC